MAKKTKMTLSQGLRKIKKLKGEMSKHQQRFYAAVVYKEEEPPAFPFKDAAAQVGRTRENLINLSAAVAEVNAVTMVKYKGKEISIAKALRILQELKGLINELRMLDRFRLRKERKTTETEKTMGFEDITDGKGNYTGQRHVEKEVKTVIISNMTIAERDKAVEEAENEFEALNNEVETANHTTLFEVDLS